jgi:hypothetical protein
MLLSFRLPPMAALPPMHRRLTFLSAILLSAALFGPSLLRGQMKQGPDLTIFFTGDDAGEVAPCG